MNKVSNNGEMKGPSNRWMYFRFLEMIITAMVVMYWIMFIGSWEADHIRFSQSRIFMTAAMGGAMTLIMLAWMRKMYKSRKANAWLIIFGIVLLGAGIVLDRSQATVKDRGFMQAMIPHHSLAITRSERADISDPRVCELAYKISESQRREIREMDWLLEDIRVNGEASDAAEAAARPVPEFSDRSRRSCP